MTLFFKLKKSFNDFKSFISKFLPYSDKDLQLLIINIIKELKNEEYIIIFDQYQEEIFGNNNFIIQLKNLLFDKECKIKVIISSSMNDTPIRDAYLNMISESINYSKKNLKGDKGDNKSNDFIPYCFTEKLIDAEQIKTIVEDLKIENKNEFNSSLKLFNYLPLYYILCRQYNKNLDILIVHTKERIKDKVLKFYNKDLNLKYMDEIRKMIDNEITVDNLQFYKEYIPFKYFFIEKQNHTMNNKTMILRTHFPLINDVWNEIIMDETIGLFDGEITYPGNVIGSFLELNLITNIKNKNIPLEIDNFVKVDTINNFGKIVEKNTDDFTNKNIFITQNNQNGENFDLAYIKGKNETKKKLVYIQVKKSYSNNRVDIITMNERFQNTKENFSKLFGFVPDDCILVYISLYNNVIETIISDHDDCKKNKSKRVSDLGTDANSIYYAINKLNSFCTLNNIQLYYYDPNNHSFFIKQNNNFIETKLDLFRENEKTISLRLDYSYMLNIYKENCQKSIDINIKYKNFLNNKEKEKFTYIIDKFDFGKVFDFAKDYFKNAKIVSFFDFQNSHLDWKILNLTSKNSILCYKIYIEEHYNIVSFLYNNLLFKYDKFSIKYCPGSPNYFERDIDYIVVISFDSILNCLKTIMPNKS